MAKTLVERVWAWLHETFPERQIYIRSDGRVQFFTFGPSLQATLAGLSLIFLGWVAFATVNVIFKDRIIAAKDHRYQQMQSAYENRVADLQISYDELNGALVTAEDKFQSAAGALQNKQNSILQFLSHKAEVEKTLAGLSSTNALPQAPDGKDGPASDSLGVAAPAGMSTPADGDDSDAVGSALTAMPVPPPPQPRAAKPSKSSLLESALRHFASLFIAAPPAAAATITPANVLAQHPALRALDQDTARIEQLGTDEAQMMLDTETELHGEVAKLQDVMGRTGIRPDQFLRKVEASEGVGGPDVPLDSVQVIGLDPGPFNTAYLHADAVLNQMDTLLAAMSHVPLATPVSGAGFERTSGFGARIDPFNGQYAFHPGVDFAGPWGAVVEATAPGVVVFAGTRGSYGKMVEIDHGFGIHTRYGHLSAINVQVGAKVGKGTAIGRLGSTGRSTGPHVHYEIWYENVVRNPSNFIEAGRHVL